MAFIQLLVGSIWSITPCESRKVSNKANKYLRKKLNLLHKHAKNGEKERFWFQAKILLTRSYSFRLLNLRKVEKNWYKDLHTKEIKKSLSKLNDLIKNFSYKFEFKRVYIPKPDGSRRGLSVPPLHCRIWASMWYIILVIYLDAVNPTYWSNQHGGKPRSGVNTAWKFLYKQVIKNENVKNIFEYDIKKFFDRVNHNIILEALEDCQVPDPMINWIMNSIKHFECDLSLDEWKEDLRNKGLEDSVVNKISSVEEAKELNNKMAKGVPQGFALSPVLSCLAKSYALKNFATKMICYVDDGILYSEDQIDFDSFNKALVNLGTEINVEKSGWLKKDGSWSKENFKFLGIEYNTTQDAMKASSRSGRSSKLFPKANWENCKNIEFLNYASKHGEITATIDWNLFDSLISWTWTPDDMKLETLNHHIISCRFSHCFLNDYSSLIKLISPRTSANTFNLPARCSQAIYFTYKTGLWSPSLFK